MISLLRHPSCSIDVPRSALSSLPKRSAPATDLTAAQISMSLDAELHLTTIEGDEVTISAGAETRIDDAFYRPGRGHHGRATSFAPGMLRAERSARLEIDVQGDLSGQELADIGRLLRGIDRVVHDFTKGRLDAVARDVSQIHDVDSIESFELDLERRVSVAIARLRGDGSDPPADARTLEHPAIEPIGTAPVRAEPLPERILAA